MNTIFPWYSYYVRTLTIAYPAVEYKKPKGWLGKERIPSAVIAPWLLFIRYWWWLMKRIFSRTLMLVGGGARGSHPTSNIKSRQKFVNFPPAPFIGINNHKRYTFGLPGTELEKRTPLYFFIAPFRRDRRLSSVLMYFINGSQVYHFPWSSFPTLSPSLSLLALVRPWSLSRPWFYMQSAVHLLIASNVKELRPAFSFSLHVRSLTETFPSPSAVYPSFQVFSSTNRNHCRK